MEPVFFLTHNQLGVNKDIKVLKAEEYATFFDAQDIIQGAQERAAIIVAEAEEEYRRMQRKGYESGLEEGRIAMADKMIEQVAASVDYFASIEKTMVDVVTTAIEKIIGAIDDGERIAAVVHRALQYVRNQKKVLVRIAPEDVSFVQEKLNDIIRAYPGITFLDVLPDAKLTRGDCILESEVGVVNASISKQVETIKNAFIKHLQKKSSHTAV